MGLKSAFALSGKETFGKQINDIMKLLEGCFQYLRNEMFPVNLKECLGSYANFKLISVQIFKNIFYNSHVLSQPHLCLVKSFSVRFY